MARPEDGPWHSLVAGTHEQKAQDQAHAKGSGYGGGRAAADLVSDHAQALAALDGGGLEGVLEVGLGLDGRAAPGVIGIAGKDAAIGLEVAEIVLHGVEVTLKR